MMFDADSRYAGLPTDETEDARGRRATVVRLRLLPPTGGQPYEVGGGDRLDLLAQRKYRDATRFWHIADANTELDAARLTENAPPENPLAEQPTKIIAVPES